MFSSNFQELKQKINVLASTIAGNFTRLREVQIRSLLHFNKRLHNIYRDLMRTRQDMDKMTAMMKGLKGNDTANKEYVRDSIADLKSAKARFGAHIRSLQQRIAKLHLDMSSFHQLIRVIMSNLKSLKRQVLTIFQAINLGFLLYFFFSKELKHLLESLTFVISIWITNYYK